MNREPLRRFMTVAIFVSSAATVVAIIGVISIQVLHLF